MKDEWTAGQVVSFLTNRDSSQPSITTREKSIELCYTDVLSLNGGFCGWAETDYPVAEIEAMNLSIN